MIKDWLKSRLVPTKLDSELWSSFSDALQSLYESEIEPILKRLSNRRSLFTMDDEDLNTRIAEYGRFFVLGEIEQSQKAMLLTQRLDEVHFKGTTRPIEQTFWREFGNLPVTWEPLYAPTDQDKYPYGSYFATSDAIPVSESTYGRFFLTSRGKIQVDLNTLYESYGLQDRDAIIDTLLDKFDLIIAPLLPLHIVFDGITLQLAFKLTSRAEKLRYVESIVSIVGMKWEAKKDASTNVHMKAGTGLSAYRADNAKEMNQVYLSVDSFPLDAWLIDAPAINTLVLPK